MKKIKLLESFRGMAAMLVLFHHIFVIFPNQFTRIVLQYPRAYRFLVFLSDLNLIAVLFFFVLSGFVIQLSVGHMQFNNQRNVLNYLAKRIKRILPLYFSAIIVSFLYGLLSDSFNDPSFSLSNFIGNILFLQTSAWTPGAWFIPFGKNGPLWSLAYEMFFYLFFPFFTILIVWFVNISKLNKYKDFIAVAAALFLSFLGLAIRFAVFSPYASYLSLFCIWYGGVFLAIVYKGTGRLMYEALLFLMALVFLLLSSLYFQSDTITVLMKGIGIILTGYFFLMVQPLIKKRKFFEQLEKLVNTLFFKTGTGSYAIYVMHYPLLLIIKYFYHDISFWMLTIILTVFVFFMIRLETGLVTVFSTSKKSNYVKM